MSEKKENKSKNNKVEPTTVEKIILNESDIKNIEVAFTALRKESFENEEALKIIILTREKVSAFIKQNNNIEEESIINKN